MEPEQKMTCECTYECKNLFGERARFWARIVIPHYPLNPKQENILAAWLGQHNEVNRWSQAEESELLTIVPITVRVIEENITLDEIRRMYRLLTEFLCVTRIPLP